MQTRNYDTMFDEYTGSTETNMATDEHLSLEDLRAYVEGFAAASGVRPDTAASGGRIRHPEDRDSASNEGRVSNHLEEENAGLADS